nr:DUF402 domain-containing protein [Streptomyces sp. DSM 41633]
MRGFETGQTVVRRDVHRLGRVWSEQALRVVADTGEALVTACVPGAQARWPALYAQARAEGDRSVRTEAFDAMATGEWELAGAVWQETDLLLWKPPAAWFSANAFFVPDGDGRRVRNWYVNFEHPTRRTTTDGFDTLDLTVDLVVTPDLTRWEWRTKTSTPTCDGSASSPTPSTRPSTPPAVRSWRCSPNAPGSSRRPSGGRPGGGSRPGQPLPSPAHSRRGEGCTGRGLNGCLDGCFQRGTEGVTGSGSPANRTPPVVPGQPYWASLSASTTPLIR